MDGRRNILFLIVVISTRATFEYEIIKFISSPALEGHTCGTDDNISQRMIQTRLMCSCLYAIRSDCLSLFYNASTSTCVLCRVQNNVVTEQPVHPGFVCYNKVNNVTGEVYVGEDCSNNGTCLNSKMSCYPTTLTCLCNPFRQYNRTRDFCEKNCIRLGEGFQKYSKRIPDRSEKSMLVVPSVAECSTECLGFAKTTCNGFAYNQTSGHCLLFNVVSVLVANETDTYIRECI